MSPRSPILIASLAAALAACVGQAPVEIGPSEPETAPPSGTQSGAISPTALPSEPAADAQPGSLAGSWSFGGQMPTARSEMPAVEIDGLVYVPGGFSGLLGSNRLEAYEIGADRWHQLADMPQARHHLMATAHQGALYVLGGSGPVGFSPTDNAWRYDPDQDRWTELPVLPERRMSGAAVALGGALYVVGGTGGSQDLLVYDPSAQSWSRRAGPRQPSEHTAAVAYAGELWLIGGRWSGVGELTRVEIYDPADDRWRAGPPLQTARGGFASATDGEQIFVAGGEVIMSGNLTLASVELFDPSSGSWVSGVDLPFPVHGVDAIEHQGSFLVMGGSDRAGGIDNHGRVQIYAP